MELDRLHYAPKNYKPDIMGVRNDGLIDIIEVQSPSQTEVFMKGKVKILREMLGNRAGDVDYISRLVK